MPAPTMRTFVHVSLRTRMKRLGRAAIQQIGKRTVNLDGLRSLDEAHAHARGACGLADEALGAGPVAETGIVGGVFARHPVAMGAPTIAVDGARQFLPTAP